MSASECEEASTTMGDQGETCLRGRARTLTQRLWTFLTGALLVVSATTDVRTTGHIALLHDPSDMFQWKPQDPEVSFYFDSTVDHRGQVAQEAEIAIRLLEHFESELLLPELVRYVDRVRAVVERTSDNLSALEARRFAAGLQVARAQLVEEASSFPIWARVVRQVDPSEGPRPIPKQFLRPVPEEETPPLMLTAAEARVVRAVERFRGDDGYSPARAG